MADQAWKAHERATAAAFSRWLTEGREGQVISRQALHGRMVERLWGDLAIHPDCPARWQPAAAWFMGRVFVDCKRRAAFTLPAMLSSPGHAFWAWWEKITDQSPSDRLRLMVLMERGKRLLAYGSRERVAFGGLFGNTAPEPHLDLFGGPERVTICHFEGWLRWVDAEGLGRPAPGKAFV